MEDKIVVKNVSKMFGKEKVLDNVSLTVKKGSISVSAIKRRSDNRPVYVNATMEDLIDKALNQNFVPVVDDQKNFIGIITRKDIISYCYGRLCEAERS